MPEETRDQAEVEEILTPSQRAAKLVQRVWKINYFRPERTLQEANAILPQVDKIIDDYQHALEMWRQMGEDLPIIANEKKCVWAKIANEAYLDVLDSVKRAERIEEYTTAFEEGKRGAFSTIFNFLRYPVDLYALQEATLYAAKAAVWEVASDLPGFENNPDAHILSLFEMGLKPTGFKKLTMYDGIQHSKEEKEAFVVDIPLIIDGKPILGCYAYGDIEIKFVHEWPHRCMSLSPTIPIYRMVE